MHQATCLSSRKIDVYHVHLLFLFWFLWFFSIKEFSSQLFIQANYVSLTFTILSLSAISALMIFVAFFLLSWKPKLVSNYIYGIIFFLFCTRFINDVYVAVTNEPYLGPEVIGYALAGPFTTFAIVGGLFESKDYLFLFFIIFAFWGVLCLLSWIFAKISSKRIAPLSYVPTQKKSFIVGLLSGVAFFCLITITKTLNAHAGFITQFWIDILENINRPLASETMITTPPNKPLKPLLSIANPHYKNVVIVFLESVGKKAIDYLDLHTNTTLRTLSEHSLDFSNARAIVPLTAKSIYATLCGLTPRLEAVNIDVELDFKAACLPELLKGVGYTVAFFDTTLKDHEYREEFVTNYLGVKTYYPPNVSNAVWYMSWKSQTPLLEDKFLLGPSKTWLNTLNGKPFLAIYVTYTPHFTYNIPINSPIKQYTTKNDYNKYLNAIEHLDKFLARLIDQYKKFGLYKNTLFVFVGDHGEAFGEHGKFLHASVPYEEVLRVPLLIHNASFSYKKIDRPVSHLDILPTVVEGLGYSLPNGYDGHSLFKDNVAKIAPSYCHRRKQCMVIFYNGWKYIHNYKIKMDELYYLPDDSYERNNLVSRHPVLRDSFLEIVTAWKEDKNARYGLRRGSIWDSVYARGMSKRAVDETAMRK